jgi:FkbM family methyltransferase
VDYEQAVENFYSSILKQGDVVIDCGAHSGRHTRPLAELVGEDGHVYAFEPLPGPFNMLQKSLSCNKNVTLFNCALGTESGNASFVYVPKFPEYSGFRERIYHDDKIERRNINVTVARLDDRIPNRAIRYIKVDAEGGDLTILRGGTQKLLDSRPIVTFECGDNSIKNYDYTSADYFDFFDRMGYRVSNILGENLNRKAFIESSRLQKVWDYVASPSS